MQTNALHYKVDATNKVLKQSEAHSNNSNVQKYAFFYI